MSSKQRIAASGALRPIELDVRAYEDPMMDACPPEPDVLPRSMPRHSPAALAVRYALDMVISVLVVVIAIIPCLLIAVLVKTTSRGPVFFAQERVGRGGESFRLYKFRTMRRGTHDDVIADQATRAAYEANDFKLPPDDPRITPLGRMLRKTSLDELPQFVNVLRGEMSIVGVRPLLPRELKLRPTYDQELYCMLRPGLTGLWQVAGRSSVGKTDRVALDRRYIEQWSVRGDLMIMVRTPVAVLRIHHAH